MKNLVIIAMAFFFAGGFGTVEAQQVEDLKRELAELETTMEANTKTRVSLEDQIAKLVTSGWNFGGVGAVTGNWAAFSDWALAENARDNMNVLGDVSLYGNYNADKFFWRNGVNMRLGYQRFEETIEESDTTGGTWDNSLDEIFLSSLAGYKISEELALSALFDARTTFGTFFDPAYISLGAGVTYTPHPNFAVVLHPATAQGVFVRSEAKKAEFGVGADDLGDGLYSFGDGAGVKLEFGAKIVVDYTKSNFLIPGLTYTGRADAFIPYGSSKSYEVFNVVTNTQYTVSEESDRNIQVNITNKLGYALSKYINLAVGIDFRYYKPEIDKWQMRQAVGVGITTTF